MGLTVLSVAATLAFTGWLLAQLPGGWEKLRLAVSTRWPAIVALWQEHDLTPRLTQAIQQHGDWLARALNTLGGTAWSAGRSAGQILTASLGWLVLAVIFAVQMIEAYALTPRIMGRQTGLPPLAIIVAIFFWGTALDGLAGMILAIPLTAFLVVFWRLARSKYIRALV